MINAWNGRHLSIGGRLTLINSVLSSLPLYFFSFFKAPSCVLKELVNIQRKFLWGGSSNTKKICWVSWDTICLPKDRGGLGIKNLDLFNQSLLCKWKWRGISDENALWSTLLKYRYGNMVDNFMSQSTNDVIGHSLWWRDIMKIGGVVNGDWFKKNVSNVLGDGLSLRFWHDVWLRPVCFKSLFPILFNKALYPNIVVGASGMWQDHTWVWKMDWSSVLSATEQELAQELDTLLTGFFPYPNDKDRVRWNIHQTGQFSVHSTYVFLLSRVVTLAIDENVVEALNQLWTNDMPSKVSIFGWRLLLSRLPTRMALAKKGVIVNPRELCCAFCFREEEDIDHVFFNCSFSQQIWKGIFVWLNVDFIPYEVCWQHFISFGALVKNKSYAKARHVIWLATTWSLWRARNNIMFRGDVINLQSLINQIIYISWFWFVGRIASKSSLVFSDWCKDPLSCIFSI
ncbi:unnamed protein product [Trifolium pratense]|uniref:Uncharacterized protein n=1 Tax=Trifolium pratense TaxID=57577 RepID=A0ACB0JIF2_TRIPR|nr:unnamed protein product [Trifolium pratense]